MLRVSELDYAIDSIHTSHKKIFTNFGENIYKRTGAANLYIKRDTKKEAPKKDTPEIKADFIDPTACFLVAPTTIIFLGFLPEREQNWFTSFKKLLVFSSIFILRELHRLRRADTKEVQTIKYYLFNS